MAIDSLRAHVWHKDLIGRLSEPQHQSFTNNILHVDLVAFRIRILTVILIWWLITSFHATIVWQKLLSLLFFSKLLKLIHAILSLSFCPHFLDVLGIWVVLSFEWILISLYTKDWSIREIRSEAELLLNSYHLSVVIVIVLEFSLTCSTSVVSFHKSISSAFVRFSILSDKRTTALIFNSWVFNLLVFFVLFLFIFELITLMVNFLIKGK